MTSSSLHSNPAFANVRGAIIDLDGTLLDTAADFTQALNTLLAELDLASLSQETITGFIGKGTEHLVHSALAARLPAAEVAQRLDAAYARYQTIYRDINGDHAPLFPQVKEGLKALLNQGIRLACVTNKPIDFALPLLEKKNLIQYFEFTYGGDSFAFKKPHPYPLQQACQRFDLPAHQVVVIGDSINDAQAAQAAGCPVMLLPYGYNHGQPVQDAKPDAIVQTLLDAAHLVRS